MNRLRLFVLDETAGWAEELVLGDNEGELLALQLELCLQRGSPETFARWLAQALSSVLPDAVAYDIKPPSEAQVKYAMVIARTLGLPLPPEVLRFRGAMHNFLTTYVEPFRRRSSTVSPNT